MKLWWEDGTVRLYHGDCRDLDTDIVEAGSVDLLLTDPPYGRMYRGFGLTTQNANIAADGARQGMRTLRGCLSGLDELLSPTAHLLVMCHWQSWPDFYDVMASHGKIQNALIWHKDRGGMGDCEVGYAVDYEVVLYATRGRRGLAGGRPSAVITGIPPCSARARSHPTEKPEALMETLIKRHAPEGGLVVDPFVGAGSTLVAARRLGMRAVGVDIDRRWCDVVAERLRQGELL